MFRNSKAHYDSKVDKTDSVIYFNANIFNNPVTANQSAKVARFNQSISSGSIIDLPENYYLAIVRFAISHMLIPLYQFKENFYSVTITREDGALKQEFLIYENIGNYSQYGYKNPVFFYSQFANMVSDALKRAHDYLFDPADPHPFLHYGPETERFTLYVPDDANYYDGVDTHATISFNANLFQQLQLINSTFNGFNSADGKDYTVNYFSDPLGFNLYVSGANPYYFYTQERSALYLLNEVQSIVFTSATLAVTKEYIGSNDGSGNAGSVGIIADFVPDQSTGRDLSEYQYNVQGPPRLVNLTNTIPITNIDYQVGIRFRDGTIVPLYLEPGETCEVKFGFFKKSLYDNNFEY